jgi:hypothetical protein
VRYTAAGALQDCRGVVASVCKEKTYRVLGTLDREDWEKTELRHERQVWWDISIDWAKDLLGKLTVACHGISSRGLRMLCIKAELGIAKR